jgi:hypothetical protein
MKATAKYIVFKRWDKLETKDNPEVVIFYARPDVLAGLYTLASFDEVQQRINSLGGGAGGGR